jgi:alpha-tubulin suppressor-like RCC1 family protein
MTSAEATVTTANPLRDGMGQAPFPVGVLVRENVILSDTAVYQMGFFFLDSQREVLSHESYLAKLQTRRTFMRNRGKAVAPDSKHIRLYVSSVLQHQGAESGAARNSRGSADEMEALETPRRVDNMGSSPIAVAAGANTLGTVTRAGNVYILGATKLHPVCRGQRGEEGSTGVARIRVRGARFTMLSLGSYHGLAITESGEAYSWGHSINCSLLGVQGDKNAQAMRKKDPSYTPSGQLGRGPIYLGGPAKVHDFTTHAHAVAAGGVHSAIIASEGAFVFGLNAEGQLGRISSEVSAAMSPLLLRAPSPVVAFTALACGAHHTVGITSDGRCFAWGYNAQGQVGVPIASFTQCVEAPTPVRSLTGVRCAAVAAGDLHSVVLSRAGGVYTWGADSHGQLGRDGPPHVPNIVTALVDATVFAVSVAAGSHSTGCVTDLGNVYTWGRLLGRSMAMHSYAPRRVESMDGRFVVGLAMGITHVAMLVSRPLSEAIETARRVRIRSAAQSARVREVYLPRTWPDFLRIASDVLGIEAVAIVDDATSTEISTIEAATSAVGPFVVLAQKPDEGGPNSLRISGHVNLGSSQSDASSRANQVPSIGEPGNLSNPVAAAFAAARSRSPRFTSSGESDFGSPSPLESDDVARRISMSPPRQTTSSSSAFVLGKSSRLKAAFIKHSKGSSGDDDMSSNSGRPSSKTSTPSRSNRGDPSDSPSPDVRLHAKASVEPGSAGTLSIEQRREAILQAGLAADVIEEALLRRAAESEVLLEKSNAEFAVDHGDGDDQGDDDNLDEADDEATPLVNELGTAGYADGDALEKAIATRTQSSSSGSMPSVSQMSVHNLQDAMQHAEQASERGGAVDDPYAELCEDELSSESGSAAESAVDAYAAIVEGGAGNHGSNGGGVDAHKSSSATSGERSVRVNSGTDTDVHVIRSSAFDWNRRFQQVLLSVAQADSPQERQRCYSELSALVIDFINMATTYARIIIGETFLPLEEKTIKPVDFGGVAGGEKFIVHGILFKFANNRSGLYPDEGAAAKVAAHDLKGLRAYFNAGMPGLHYPLMALVDYSGFRLSCQSLLPIDADTLVYGSSDGALHVQADPKFHQVLLRAANILNCKPHVAGRGRQTVEVASPVDLEGHMGNDDKAYLVDFSRSMPPEEPVPGLRAATLYRLLRPEFVKQYPVPLCCDAFSAFVPNDAEAEKHKEEVREATHYLRTVAVPRVAAALSAMLRAGWDVSLVAAVHRGGVNLRYLGLVRSHVRDVALRDRMMVEMVARVIKEQLRVKMREALADTVLPLEDPRRQAVVKHMNLVFGDSSVSRQFWTTTLKKRLIEKYEGALSADEATDAYDMRSAMQHLMPALFKRLVTVAGLRFTDVAHETFSKSPEVFDSFAPFDVTDVSELSLQVKHINIVERALGYILKSKARQQRKNSPERTRLLKQAMSKFEAALESDPDNINVLRNYSDVLAMLGLTRLADFFYRRAIEVDPSGPTTLFAYAVFLESERRYDECERFYLRCLEENPLNDHCLQSYGYFIEEKLQDSDTAESFFQMASMVRAVKSRIRMKLQSAATGLFEY